MNSKFKQSVFLATYVAILGSCATSSTYDPNAVRVEDRTATPREVTPPPTPAPTSGGSRPISEARRAAKSPVTPAPKPEPISSEPASSPASGRDQGTESSNAVVALLDDAGKAGQARRFENAAASLERALRIEPENADVWYRLAVIRLLQGQHLQAEQLAMKSSQLAGNNKLLQQNNWRLIAEARRRRGDQAGAQAALRRLNEFKN